SPHGRRIPRATRRQEGIERSAVLGDLICQQGVFEAVLAATLLDFAQLIPGRGDVVEGEIRLTQIFARPHVVGIDAQRLLVVAETDRNAPGLAMSVAEVVEDA